MQGFRWIDSSTFLPHFQNKPCQPILYFFSRHIFYGRNYINPASPPFIEYTHTIFCVCQCFCWYSTLSCLLNFGVTLVWSKAGILWLWEWLIDATATGRGVAIYSVCRPCSYNWLAAMKSSSSSSSSFINWRR